MFTIEAYKLFDSATVIGSLLLTLFLLSPPDFSVAGFLSLQMSVRHVVVLAVFVTMWRYVFAGCGLYQSKRLSTRYVEVRDVLKSTSLGCACIAVVGTMTDSGLLVGQFISLFWVSVSVAMITNRLFLRSILAWVRRKGINRKRVVVVGAGPRGMELADILVRKKELGYSIIGFLDDADMAQTGSLPWPILGSFQDLPDILTQNVVDEVFVGLPMKSYYDTIQAAIADCREQGITVRISTDLHTSLLAKSILSKLEEKPILTVCSVVDEDPRLRLKRALDVVGAALLLVALSPLLLLTALAVRLSSPGPAFFVQERVGYHKRIFKMLKFRTMVDDAEKLLPSIEHLNEMDGPTFKVSRDPRVTGLGAILRRTSIDELPQLINVLKGDMSLVGPRPLPLRDYRGFDENWQKRRFSMKPGLTCLWQVNGRNSVPFREWMEMDMRYVDHWSLSLDAKILAKTIPSVLLGRGAT